MKSVFTSLLVIGLCAVIFPPFFAGAQGGRAQARRQPPRPEKTLAQLVRRHERLTLDPGAAARRVRANGRLSIATGEHRFEVALQPNDMRSADYRAEETDEYGVRREVASAPVRTYKGTVGGRADAQARFTVDDRTVEGAIITPGERYYVEPLRKYEPGAAATDFVLYKKSDVIADPAESCGVTLDEEVGKAADGISAQVARALTAEAAAATWTQAEIATEADYEYVTALGGSAAAANADILGIMNQVEGVYEMEMGITFKVVYQHAWAAKGTGYPYSATAVGSQVLEEFTNHWNASFKGVTRDLAHLWTGKDLVDSGNNPGLIGIAWLGSVCANPARAYGVSQRMTSVVQKHILAAHEIGHNFGAYHSDSKAGCGNTIMGAYIGTGLTFCPFSRGEITSFAGLNSSCLAQVPPDCTYALSSTGQSFRTTGGTGSVSVTAAFACAWTAKSNVSWVTITSGASGTASQTVNYTVAANPSTTLRTGTLTIAGKTYTVTQAAQPVITALTMSPRSVVGGKNVTGKVTLSEPAPAGGALVTLSDNLTVTTVPASVTIPAGMTSKAFPITTTYTATQQAGTVTARYGESVASAPLTVVTVSVASVALTPNLAVGGNSVAATVSLNGPAPAGGAAVALSDNLAATTVPAGVTVPAGATKASFTVNTSKVLAKQTGTLSAAYGVATKTAGLTVRPVGVLAVSVNPNPVVGGNSMTGTVTLELAAPASMTVALTDNMGAVTTPASVVVPAGATSKSFTLTTTAVTGSQSGQLTASVNGTAKSVAIGLNPATVGCASPTFKQTGRADVGTTPNGIAAGDFNRDGRPDLAVPNYNSSSVSVLLGDGVGGFIPATNYAVAAGAMAVAAADYNLDGKQDMAVVVRDKPYIVFFWGDGAGGFSAPAIYNVGMAWAYDMVTGDFNNDGKPDLALGGYYSYPEVTVLLGDGQGKFTSHRTRGGRVDKITTGDFNRDGKLDILEANTYDSTVTVMLGDGAGGFAVRAPLRAGGQPVFATVSDFNHDGSPDVAVGYQWSANVGIMIGNGAGGLAAPKLINVGDYAYGLFAADLNGDSKNDLAVTLAYNHGLALLHGNGVGGFQAPVNLALDASSRPYAIASGDFNSDRMADLVVAAQGNNTVMVLLKGCH